MRFSKTRGASHRAYVARGAAALTLFMGGSYALAGAGSMSPGPVTASPLSVATGQLGQDVRADARGRVFTVSGSCANSPVAFISDLDGRVFEMNAAGVVCATLTGFNTPGGMATDKAGNLYVADTSYTSGSTIDEFARPYDGQPIAVYQDPDAPSDVAIDSNGNLAVTNHTALGGAIAFYAAGSTSGPTNTISTMISPLSSGAFDETGNYYFDGENGSGMGAIGEIVGGIAGTSATMLTAGNVLYSAAGLRVTKNGFLSICDTEGLVVYTYRAPMAGNLGNPIATTPLETAFAPLGIAFPPQNSLILTADATGQTQLYRFPAGGDAITTVMLPPSDPTGVAIVPGQHFSLR